jgi:hypothetical protein
MRMSKRQMKSKVFLCKIQLEQIICKCNCNDFQAYKHELVDVKSFNQIKQKVGTRSELSTINIFLSSLIASLFETR